MEVYNRRQTGELQGSATAIQCPDVPWCRMVIFKALTSNVGDVYMGGPDVTIPDGTTDATSGLELSPGDFSPWIPVNNLNMMWRICDNAGDDLTYLALG
jgi:hypothetical protein